MPARSTFRCQNAKSTAYSEHFSKLRCSKSARRCGAKHMSKSKCAKRVIFGALLEVEMLNKCTALWREGHLEVKNVKGTTCSDHFWTLKRRFVWQAQRILHLAKSEQNVRVL